MGEIIAIVVLGGLVAMAGFALLGSLCVSHELKLSNRLLADKLLECADYLVNGTAGLGVSATEERRYAIAIADEIRELVRGIEKGGADD